MLRNASPKSALRGVSSHPPSVATADTTRSPVRMNQLRSDSRKLRATEEMAIASARLSAMTAVVTPVRPGERLKLSTATLPANPKALGSTCRRSLVVQLMSGIEMTNAEWDQIVLAKITQVLERVVILM